MESSGNFGMSALIGGLLALIVIALIVVRIVWPRKPRTPPPSPPLPQDTDAAFLDSSHIIGSSYDAKEPAARGAEGDARKPGTDSAP